MRYSSTSQLKLQYQITYTEKDTEVSSYIQSDDQLLHDASMNTSLLIRLLIISVVKPYAQAMTDISDSLQ